MRKRANDRHYRVERRQGRRIERDRATDGADLYVAAGAVALYHNVFVVTSFVEGG